VRSDSPFSPITCTGHSVAFGMKSHNQVNALWNCVTDNEMRGRKTRLAPGGCSVDMSSPRVNSTASFSENSNSRLMFLTGK